MKGMFKRALAGVAAAALAATGLALGAGAASAAAVDNANIVLHGENVADSTFAAYKLGDYAAPQIAEDGSVSSVAITTDTDWTDALEAAITAANLTDAYTTGQYRNNPAAFVASQSGENLRKLAEALAATDPKPAADVADGTMVKVDASVTVPITDDGFYLITDTRGNPILIGSPVQTSEDSAKYDDEIGGSKLGVGYLKPKTAPTPDKTVESANPEITFDGETVYVGQKLKYTVTSTVTGTASYDAYTWTVTDIADSGLTVDAGNLQVTLGDVTLEKDTDYTVTSEPTQDGKTKTVVTIKNVAGEDGQEVVVTYTATVNSNAVGAAVGNTATISQNGGSEGRGDTVTVHTYGFDFTKIDPDNNALDGAKFSIKNVDVKYLSQDSDTKAWTAGEEPVLFSGEVGKFSFQGLAAGTYTVTEEEAPAGYMQTAKPSFQVTIKNDGSLEWKIGTADGDPLDLVQKGEQGAVTVLNVRNVTQLPMTGAAGTALFTVLGLLIAGAGALVYMKSRNVKHALRG